MSNLETYDSHMAKGARLTEIKAKLASEKKDLASIPVLQPIAHKMGLHIVGNKTRDRIAVYTEAIKQIEAGK